MNLTLNEQPECHPHNKIFLFWSFSRNYSKSIRVQMNQRYKIMWNNTVFPFFYLSLENICGIQHQLLQTTRQLPGFTRCVPWLSDPPWSESLILGQQFKESRRTLVQEKNCLGSSLQTENTEPKCLLKGQGWWKLPLDTGSSTTQISLHLCWTRRMKQLPKARGNSKNMIFFSLLHV